MPGTGPAGCIAASEFNRMNRRVDLLRLVVFKAVEDFITSERMCSPILAQWKGRQDSRRCCLRCSPRCSAFGTNSAWVPGSSPAREDLLAQAVCHALNVAAGAGLPCESQPHSKESLVKVWNVRAGGSRDAKGILGENCFLSPAQKASASQLKTSWKMPASGCFPLKNTTATGKRRTCFEALGCRL